MPKSIGKEGGKVEGREKDKFFIWSPRSQMWGGGLIGKEEDKWQSKSWELCPNTPTTDKGTPKEVLHVHCPPSWAVQNLHNPYSGPSL